MIEFAVLMFKITASKIYGFMVRAIMPWEHTTIMPRRNQRPNSKPFSTSGNAKGPYGFTAGFL